MEDHGTLKDRVHAASERLREWVGHTALAWLDSGALPESLEDLAAWCRSQQGLAVLSTVGISTSAVFLAFYLRRRSCASKQAATSVQEAAAIPEGAAQEDALTDTEDEPLTDSDDLEEEQGNGFKLRKKSEGLGLRKQSRQVGQQKVAEQSGLRRGFAAAPAPSGRKPPSATPSRSSLRIVKNDNTDMLESSYTFIFPPEQHISVDIQELKQTIKDRLPLDQREDLEEFVKLLTGVANFDFYDLKQRIRTNFLPFASGARNSTFLQRSSKSLPTTKLLDEKEEQFISDVYEVLRASHYTLLTKEEWSLATSENFNLNLPMEVKWQFMDKGLLDAFWNSTAERKLIRKELPDSMADRILVFHRGIGTEKLKGLLLDQKIDLLMDYTLGYAFDKVKLLLSRAWSQLLVAVGLRDPESIEARALSKTMTLMRTMTAAGRAAAYEAEVREGAAVNTYELENGNLVVSDHRFAKKVERMTLSRQCPTVFTLLKAFPRVMELEEPTYKDLVVVYRRALPPRKPPKASANAPNKTKLERMRGLLAYRNINIKVFGETPMADVEMIFPEKSVSLKPLHLAHIAVVVVTSLVAGVTTVYKKGEDSMGSSVLWTAASLVLMRIFTLYNSAQTQRSVLQQRMTNTLFEKMAHSQEGVISVITEEMGEQQLKQMLLAYMLLIIKDRPMLPDDLDTVCEDFLLKEFDLAVDFDLDAALPRLKSWYLVQEDAQGKLSAMPLSDAKAVLEVAWSTAYTCIGGGKTDQLGNKRNVPTLDLITGNHSVFAEGIKMFLAGRDIHEAVADVKHQKNVLAAGLDLAGNMAGTVAKGAGKTMVGVGKTAVGAGKTVYGAGRTVGGAVDKVFVSPMARFGKAAAASVGGASSSADDTRSGSTSSGGFAKWIGRQPSPQQQQQQQQYGKPPLPSLHIPSAGGAAGGNGPVSCPAPSGMNGSAGGAAGYYSGSAPTSPASVATESSYAGSVDMNGPVKKKSSNGLKKMMRKLGKNKGDKHKGAGPVEIEAVVDGSQEVSP